jgi:hypothetical protein
MAPIGLLRAKLPSPTRTGVAPRRWLVLAVPHYEEEVIATRLVAGSMTLATRSRPMSRYPPRCDRL